MAELLDIVSGKHTKNNKKLNTVANRFLFNSIFFLLLFELFNGKRSTDTNTFQITLQLRKPVSKHWDLRSLRPRGNGNGSTPFHHLSTFFFHRQLTNGEKLGNW